MNVSNKNITRCAYRYDFYKYIPQMQWFFLVLACCA